MLMLLLLLLMVVVLLLRLLAVVGLGGAVVHPCSQQPLLNCCAASTFGRVITPPADYPTCKT